MNTSISVLFGAALLLNEFAALKRFALFDTRGDFVEAGMRR